VRIARSDAFRSAASVELVDHPCVGCPLEPRCAAESLACAMFSGFVNRSLGWRNAARTPTREIYERVFSEDDFDDREAA